jgi:hypothetical protein
MGSFSLAELAVKRVRLGESKLESTTGAIGVDGDPARGFLRTLLANFVSVLAMFESVLD